MEAYVDKLVADYEREGAAPRNTPTDISILSLKKRAADDLINDRELRRYQTIIGKLLYPATQLRADISFYVGFLARSMSNPTPRHYNYALQVINYLNTTKDLVIKYEAPKGATALTIDMFATSASTGSPNLGLHGYSDAAFADSHDCKSTSSYVFMLAGGAICHRLVK